MEGIKIRIYRECPICLNIIEKDYSIPEKATYFLWIGKRNVYVCRNCAKELLKSGEIILGISLPRKEYK